MGSANRRHRCFRLGLLLFGAVSTGCSGGGGGGGGPATPSIETFDLRTIQSLSLPQSCDTGQRSGTTLSIACVTEFDDQEVQAVTESTEFSFQNADSNGTEIQMRIAESGAGNSYDLIGLEYALSIGLTGKGQTIAILDTILRATHQEFDGKTILTHGNQNPRLDPDRPSEVSHGTAVASIAAGVRKDLTDPDAPNMMGVASGADIHFSSYKNGDNSAATKAAEEAGAVFQNNSWGLIYRDQASMDPDTERSLTVKDVTDYMAENPGTTALESASVLTGFSVAGLNEYINSLESFQKNGIVGFALQNEVDADSASGVSALPEIAPQLAGSWVAVGNAAPVYDPNGRIRGVYRYSSQCFETAAYCLMADGIMGTAVADSDTSYAFGGGASYALPQVAGAIAILAEAFTNPDTNVLQLMPEELLHRLFASADNSFFVPTKYIDYGNGILHGYNETYGHGFLDIRSALLPIGELVGTSATNLDDGTQSLASAQITTSASVGNALVSSLGDTQLATFDALGAPFYMRAASLIKTDTSGTSDFQDELERFAKAGSFVSSDPDQLSDGWQLSFRGAPLATLGNGFMLSPENVAIAGNYQPAKSRGGVSVGWRFHSGSTSVMAQGFGLAPVADDVFANSISILPTDGMSYGAVQVGEASSLGAFAFVEEEGGRFESTGFAFARASALPGGGLGTLGLVMKSEDYAFMGLKSGTSDTDDFSGLAGALNFSAQWNLKEDYLGSAAKTGSIFFNAEYGMAEGEGAALVQGFDTTTFSGYAVGLRFNEVLNDSDTLTLSVRQPLRVESGAANFRLARGRDVNRNIDYENFAASLSPEARQIDFGARYGWNLDETTRINIGGYYSMNENHIEGEEGGAVMFAISKKF